MRVDNTGCSMLSTSTPSEALAIRVKRKLNSEDAIGVLSELFVARGVPGHVRSDNGPEFVAEVVKT